MQFLLFLSYFLYQCNICKEQKLLQEIRFFQLHLISVFLSKILYNIFLSALNIFLCLLDSLNFLQVFIFLLKDTLSCLNSMNFWAYFFLLDAYFRQSVFHLVHIVQLHYSNFNYLLMCSFIFDFDIFKNIFQSFLFKLSSNLY